MKVILASIFVLITTLFAFISIREPNEPDKAIQVILAMATLIMAIVLLILGNKIT